MFSWMSNAERVGNTDSEQPDVEAWAAEVAATAPNVDWKTYIQDKQYGVVISLPHECSITGTLTIDEGEKSTLKIDMIKVHELLRGQRRGIGERLLRALVSETKKYGAQRIVGHVTSKSALAVRAKVFGKENLQFHNHITGDRVERTYEQVMAEQDPVNPDNLNYDVVSEIGEREL